MFQNTNMLCLVPPPPTDGEKDPSKKDAAASGLISLNNLETCADNALRFKKKLQQDLIEVCAVVWCGGMAQ